MIIRKIKSLKFHLLNYLFEHFAIPKTRNEKISKVLLRKYLPRNPVIIDCGAHDGSDSVDLHKFLKGSVHCFEPVTHLYEKLVRRVTGMNDFFTYKIALSDNTGFSEFFISEGESDASSSLLPPKEHLKDHPKTLFNHSIKVETMTLDDWALKYGIDHVDLLWLDMQGFELNMLKASTHILDKVKVIHTEISVKETYEGVVQYKDYKKFLEQKGFTVVMEAIPKGWDMGNALFVRSTK